ncbi:unnamed protein product [marine sediment metagenome]|uniref:Uncharacterized protein n=1 Tax=marine sediment metagenome TaxID=412755 RepID=X0UE70_9ZZZZ
MHLWQDLTVQEKEKAEEKEVILEIGLQEIEETLEIDLQETEEILGIDLQIGISEVEETEEVLEIGEDLR